jgi:MYXO-CTERM domain-containing protein
MSFKTVVGAIAIGLCGLQQGARAETPVGERDNTPYVMIGNLSVTEGDSGLTPFTASLTLFNRTSPLTVRITATPGTASGTDFVFSSTEVTFPGDGSAQMVSGFIVGDIEPEGDETFTLTATAAAGDAAVPHIYSSGGMIVILDDDQARASRLHIEGATILEGGPGTSQVEVRIVLEPASTSTVTVAYQSQDGTATAKADYLPVSGTLSFAPGEVLKTVTIDILGDTLPEVQERFSVVLSQPFMALLGTPRAEVVIVDDDGAGTPPDALPPTGGIDSQSDGGVVVVAVDAETPDSVLADLIERTWPDASFEALLGNDGGVVAASDSGPVALPGPDSGGVAPRTSFNSGCSCSVDAGSRPAGLLLLVGVALAAVLRRKRR